MSRHFTLSGLLLGVTLIGLLLALIVPQARHFARARYYSDEVIDLAASADGTTFGSLLGDGRVLIWDNEGNLKATLHTLGTFGGRLALSFDGRLAAVSPAGANEYVNVYPRGTVEIWDITKRKARRALPIRAAGPWFSTSDNTLIMVIVNVSSPGVRYEIYSADNDDPPRVVSARGACYATFAPDGARIALGTVPRRLEIWNLATLYKEHEFRSSQTARLSYKRVAWAPDGQSIAALVSENDEGLVLETWDLATGVQKPVSRRVTDYNGVQLAFSPDGRHLFVINRRRDAVPGPTQVFDADTLEPVESPHLADAWGVAGGMRGETFVSAKQYTVDLVDTATLQPRQRLYEGPPPPNAWPAVSCFAVWLLVFAARLVRKRLKNRQRD